MEVFNATNDFTPPKPSVKDKLNNLIQPLKNINKKQLMGLISVLIIGAGIFIALGLTDQVQKFFSQAFMPPGSYGYGAYAAAPYSGDPTPASPSPTPTPSPSPSPSPITTNTPTPTPSASPIVTPPPSSSNKPGDTDGDGDIDIFDYNRIISYFGRTDMTNPEVKKADLNKNNQIDIFDYNLVVSNFGK